MASQAYPLTIGLPQTNYRNFAEASLLMEAGHFFWQALGEAIGRPVAQLRAATGEPVYAVIYFVEETFPEDHVLATFGLDDRLQFDVSLRAMGTLAVEARVAFDREDDLATASPHPVMRFGSVFATPQPETRQLKLAAPANAEVSRLTPLPPEENPARLTREAQATGRFGLIDEAAWPTLDLNGPTIVSYAIDPDRDTNATGLVYFANFVRMLETGERAAIPQPTRFGDRRSEAVLRDRHVLQRRIAYYGNAGASDRIAISVTRFGVPNRADLLGLRYRLNREGEVQPICLSEAILRFGPGVRSARATEPHET